MNTNSIMIEIFINIIGQSVKRHQIKFLNKSSSKLCFGHLHPLWRLIILPFGNMFTWLTCKIKKTNYINTIYTTQRIAVFVNITQSKKAKIFVFGVFWGIFWERGELINIETKDNSYSAPFISMSMQK